LASFALGFKLQICYDFGVYTFLTLYYCWSYYSFIAIQKEEGTKWLTLVGAFLAIGRGLYGAFISVIRAVPF
jgi:hypothetical protein